MANTETREIGRNGLSLMRRPCGTHSKPGMPKSTSHTPAGEYRPFVAGLETPNDTGGLQENSAGNLLGGVAMFDRRQVFVVAQVITILLLSATLLALDDETDALAARRELAASLADTGGWSVEAALLLPPPSRPLPRSVKATATGDGVIRLVVVRRDRKEIVRKGNTSNAQNRDILETVLSAVDKFRITNQNAAEDGATLRLSMMVGTGSVMIEERDVGTLDDTPTARLIRRVNRMLPAEDRVLLPFLD